MDDDPELRALIRVYMATRGVWESGWWLGPTVSVAHREDDVDHYLEVFEELLTEYVLRDGRGKAIRVGGGFTPPACSR